MIRLEVLRCHTGATIHMCDTPHEALNEKFGKGNWQLDRRQNNCFVALKKWTSDKEEYFDYDNARIICMSMVEPINATAIELNQ